MMNHYSRKNRMLWCNSNRHGTQTSEIITCHFKWFQNKSVDIYFLVQLLVHRKKKSILDKGVPIPTQTDDGPSNEDKTTNTQERRHKTVRKKKCGQKADASEIFRIIFVLFCFDFILDANGIIRQPRIVNGQWTASGRFVACLSWQNGTWIKIRNNIRLSIPRLNSIKFYWDSFKTKFKLVGLYIKTYR